MCNVPNGKEQFCPYRKKFLKKRLDKNQQSVVKHAPSDVSVTLLMDNINLYRGYRRHHILVKSATPTVWNFTVRGAIIPDRDGIIELLREKET